MSAQSRRVVLTGLGVVNPLGLNAAAFWDGMVRGQSGIKRLSAFDPAGMPSQIAGEISHFDAKNFIDKKDRKSLRVMARAIQLAVAGAQLALDDAGVKKEQLDPTRFGVEFGAGLLPTELQELGPASQVSSNCQPGSVDLKKWGSHGLPCIPPLWMLKYLPNMLASHVSILHNAQGPNNTITESEVAGLLALGEAYRILVRNQADFFLVGGADSKINPLSFVRQCLFGNLSVRNDAPEKASRPFDRHRDGTVQGEGAGVLVLEDLEHARRRGGRIYAEMVGFASAFDRNRSGRGLVRVLRAALAKAKITPEMVDHIGAHGLSSVRADPWEARALRDVFASSDRPVPVFAPKSYFGNLGAASGTSELAASILALKHGVVPATLNYEEPDPACPIPVTRTLQPGSRPYVLKLGFTEMGQCSAVVFRKWEES
jgi:3-oxoacyl-[acyl-carrier-protein] synthase II